LEAVYSIFAYLKKKHNSQMVFDLMYPKIDMSAFKKCNQKEFYSEAEEPVRPNMLEPNGKEVDCCLYIDSDHTGNGSFLFLNTAALIWSSKRQPMIKTFLLGQSLLQ
jgi:hypothetical protein